MKEKNAVTFGTWITRPDHAIVEVIAKSGYFQWLTVDIEHSPLSLSQTEELIRIIQLSEKEAYVRLSKNDETIIKRVLDMGADGIIVPNVNSGNDVEKAMNACFYPPKGNRGVGLARAQHYGPHFHEYKKKKQLKIKVIVQIEHINAVENIKDIFSIPGIYGYFIGPYDLSASVGKAGDFSCKEVQDALEKTRKAGKNFGIKSGYHVIEPDPKEVYRKQQQGYQIIGVSLDMLFLIHGMDLAFKSR